MDADKKSWEERLKKELGNDESRFPLPHGYFDRLEEEVVARRSAKRKPNRKTWLVWTISLPVAAALAIFILSRDSVDQPAAGPDMQQAAEAFYESHTRVEIAALDSLPASELKNDAEVLEWQLAIEMENIEEENEQNPLDEIAPEAIEDYLVENLNPYNEL